MARDFDLLGDPIPDNLGKPGANGHTPTAENARKIRVLLVSGLSKKRIAEEMGLTQPTLNKHYFNPGKVDFKKARAAAIADQRAKVLLQLDEASTAGNVSAQKAMLSIIEDQERQFLADETRQTAPEKITKVERPVPRGKKERLEFEAEQALIDNPILDPDRVH